MIQYGETVLLATATMSSYVREGMNWFPLMVDFEEKLYAAGRIKGSRFIKREGRPTDEAVLNARFIDRALRPLFPEGMKNDVQIIITALSFDEENDPDVIGLIGASCALHMSNIPWNGPIGAIRIGQIEDEWIVNPTYEQREVSALDLSFAGTPEKIIMVEADANEVPEDVILNAFWHGQENLAVPIKLIEEVRAAVGKEKTDVFAPKNDEEVETRKKMKEVQKIATPFITKKTIELFFGAPQATKKERYEAKDEIKKQLIEFLASEGVEEDHIKFGTTIVSDVVEQEVSRAIIEDEKRVDGRSITEIRTLESEVAVLPRVHGTGHFLRGETQVLTVLTLGSPGDEQMLDGMEITGTKRFMHHYNFPPYSVGEVKPLRGASRRDIGHGALAEKALHNMLPSKEDFPYTIRLVSEVFGSNGSSSMASTCGSTLALMDAGVPIKAPVAGIAMGLASNDKGDWKVITDIQDLEDGKGGCDFKLAGSEKGLTAIQMDTKTDGLVKEAVEKMLTQGHAARLEVLKSITNCIAEPREELSKHAPRIITITIDPEKIGSVIGPGGKMIKEIQATTEVDAIDIDDSGLVMITSTNAEGAEKARDWIAMLTKEVEAGEVYTGTVTRLMDFGAFVEVLPKKEGLVHVSKMAPWRVEQPSDILAVGDKVQVLVSEIDDMGRTNLSMKDAAGNEELFKAKKPAPGSTPAPSSTDRRPPRKSSGGTFFKRNDRNSKS